MWGGYLVFPKPAARNPSDIEMVPGCMLHLWVQAQGLLLNLLNIYAPVCDSEVAWFYQWAATYLGTLNPYKCLVLSRDFIATLKVQDHMDRE